MATVRIVLRKKKNKAGLHPLAMRITVNSRISIVHLGHYLNEEDWDAPVERVKESHPHSSLLNRLLENKTATVLGMCRDIERKKISSRKGKQEIKPQGGATFFAQADIYLEDLKFAGKYTGYRADKLRVKRFREFLNGSDIAFSEITAALLNGFKAHLVNNKPNLSERTVINHLIPIRSIFRQANKAETADRKCSHFGAGKMSIKFPNVNKSH